MELEGTARLEKADTGKVKEAVPDRCLVCPGSGFGKDDQDCNRHLGIACSVQLRKTGRDDEPPCVRSGGAGEVCIRPLDRDVDSERRPKRTKVGALDDSMKIDSCWVEWINPVLEQLVSNQLPEECL